MTGCPGKGGRGHVTQQSKKDVSGPFVPGRPTGTMDHVDKNPRPHVFKRTNVKVESEKKRREDSFIPTSGHMLMGKKAGELLSTED